MGLLMGCRVSAEVGREEQDEYRVTGTAETHIIPLVVRRSGRSGHWFKVPLGFRALAEGTATIVESLLLEPEERTAFWDEIGASAYPAVEEGTENCSSMKLYSLTRDLVTHVFGRESDLTVQVLTDFSMFHSVLNEPQTVDLLSPAWVDKWSPGWRFWHALETARAEVGRFEEFELGRDWDARCIGYYGRIGDELGWPSYDEVLESWGRLADTAKDVRALATAAIPWSDLITRGIELRRTKPSSLTLFMGLEDLTVFFPWYVADENGGFLFRKGAELVYESGEVDEEEKKRRRLARLRIDVEEWVAAKQMIYSETVFCAARALGWPCEWIGKCTAQYPWVSKPPEPCEFAAAMAFLTNDDLFAEEMRDRNIGELEGWRSHDDPGSADD